MLTKGTCSLMEEEPKRTGWTVRLLKKKTEKKENREKAKKKTREKSSDF